MSAPDRSDSLADRLARARARLAEIDTRHDDEASRTARLLALRAERLARPPAPPPAPSRGTEILHFTIGAERLGIDARHAWRVAPLSPPTPIPFAPPHLLGVVAHQGAVLPVFDPIGLLGLSRPDAPPETALYLGRAAAELVLAVSGVTHIGPPVDGLPASASGDAGAWVRGVTDDAVTLIDGDAVLADPRLFLGEAS